eukprot:1594455-Rhodomonas_salina.1
MRQCLAVAQGFRHLPRTHRADRVAPQRQMRQRHARTQRRAQVKLETLRPCLNLTTKGRSHKLHSVPRLSE